MKKDLIDFWRKGLMPLTFQEKMRSMFGLSGSAFSIIGAAMEVCGGDCTGFLRSGGGLTSVVMFRDLLPSVDIARKQCVTCTFGAV